MNAQEKATYIAYRIRRAEESVQEARLLAENAHFAGAMNRIYYAMFYAVSALALAHDFSTASHAQLRGYFNRDFVKTGRVPVELGRAFGLAYDSRTKGDYEDLVHFERDHVFEMLSEAERFIRIISRIMPAMTPES